MKRMRILVLALTAALLGGCQPAAVQTAGESGEILICASFSTMADFAGRIAGDRAQVTTLVPSGADPHDWEPTARDIVLLGQADLLVLNGAGFEHWADSVVPSLKSGNLVVVDTSLDLPLMEEGDEHRDHDHGDGHRHEVDPHVWLDPVLAGRQMEAICDALVDRDPEGAEVYRANLEEALRRCGELDRAYWETLDPLPGREIVVAHESFGYLCARYGLEQIAAQGLTPEGEPDPARMAETIAHAAREQVKVVFFEQAASAKVAEAIAREIGAGTAVLDPLEGVDPERAAAGEDYFAIMEQNLEQLAMALA